MLPYDCLSDGLQTQFEQWLQDRKPQEQKWLDNYQDVMRITRDDDTKDTGASKAQKSKVFIGSTRGKVRSAKAKIKDSLFPAGQYPFDTNPIREELKKYSDVIEEIITNQLDEMKYKRTLGNGVDSITVYGTGYIVGPFVETRKHSTVENTPYGLQESVIEYPCPMYEHARTMDVYPDSEAEDEQSGVGVYWSARKQPHEIKALKGQDGYDDEAIEYALTQTLELTSEGSGLTDQARSSMYRRTKDGRIWLQRYFGLVSKSELAEWQSKKELPEDKEGDEDEQVEAIIVMAGGVVIKAEENPDKDSKRPIRRCVYEEVEHEINGVGIAENNEPHQRVTNAAFRLYMEGKAFALLKTNSIDRSKFEASENFKLFPGKSYAMKPGLSPDERKTAIIWHDMMDVTGGWENVISLSEKFSDDDTGITKYTQGNDSSHLNKTAHGISMIMNAASLPLKEVLSNIDQMWIEGHIEDLIQWNIDYLEPAIVEAKHGQEKAQLWSEIKQFGKHNFMQFKATGSSTFMQKEVLVNKLQGFMQVAMSNPITAPMIDARELLVQVWDAAETGRESPILDEETLKNKGQNPQMQQMQGQFQEAMKQMQGQAQQAIQQLQKQIEQLNQQNQALQQQVKDKSADMALKANQQRIDAALSRMEAMIANRDSMAKAVDLTASADLKQAQAASVAMTTGLMPDQHSLEIARTLMDMETPQEAAQDGTEGTETADSGSSGEYEGGMADDPAGVSGA